MMEKATKARLRDFAQEPYRIFFPIGTLAALIGVILWPLHFHGWLSFYPGIAHAHIMAHAFFGAFIVGFLGTAFPRLISARALTGSEVSALVVIHLASLVAYCRDVVRIGDGLFTGMLLGSICMMLPRFLNRKDLPPPGFRAAKQRTPYITAPRRHGSIDLGGLQIVYRRLSLRPHCS